MSFLFTLFDLILTFICLVGFLYALMALCAFYLEWSHDLKQIKKQENTILSEIESPEPLPQVKPIFIQSNF